MTVTIPQTYELALQHHRAGRLADAEDLYRHILAAEARHPGARLRLGLIALEVGQQELAARWIDEAMALYANDAAAYSDLAKAYTMTGRLNDAARSLEQALSLDSDLPDAYYDLGEIFLTLGRIDEAVAALHKAIDFNPAHPKAYLSLGNALMEQGKFDEAIAACQRALDYEPDYAEAYNNLGNALRKTGRLAAAAAASRCAVELQPDFANGWNGLGAALADQGLLDEALGAYEKVLALDPNHKLIHGNLAITLTRLGRYDEAIAAYLKAIELDPGLARMHADLGATLAMKGSLDEAVIATRRAIALDPHFANALNNLGTMLKDLGRFDEAIAAYQRVLEINPNRADSKSNLGTTLKDQGQLDEAITAYREALQLKPNDAIAHSNLIYALHFAPGAEPAIVAEAQYRWNRQFGDPLKSFFPAPTNDRNLDRQLRIGYLSSDFRNHAVAFFIEPLLEAHDHTQYEIFCYANVARPDAFTERMVQAADKWRNVYALTDDQLAVQMRKDGIDILIDLGMHTAGHRLLAVARRPAPIQASWLGYPGTTGLDAIDYRLSDACLDPIDFEGVDSHEHVIRLPDTWCCYAPIADFPPIGVLPAASGKGVTFGSLNQFGKTNAPLLTCWASLLRSIPESHLLMICPAGEARERVLAQFRSCGVAPERLEFAPVQPWAEYIRLCERIDIALDCYPCNGMTTTCHALWMGVPVVSRAGQSAVSRAGWSLLNTLGLSELVAHSEEDYVRIAIQLASDLKRLAQLRAGLRERMQTSPLMDAPRFARNLEAAYRSMWRQWCLHVFPTES